MIKKSIVFLFLFGLFFANAQDKKAIDSLLQVTHSSKNDSLRIDAYNKLFFIEVYSDLNKSKRYYHEIFKIAQQKHSNFAYAKGYNTKGVYYDFLGKLDSANYCYNQAIKYARLSKAITVEGSALNNIGLLYWNKSYYYKAILIYNKALVIFEKTGNKEYQANVLSNIGLIYDDIDENEKARQYIEKSLEIRKQINDEYGLSVSYINLAKIIQKQGKHIEAIANYDKGIAIKIKINDLLGLAIGKHNKATPLISLKRYDEALKCLKEAEEICIKNNAESNIIENVYLGLIKVYIVTNDITKAKEYNEKMFLISQKNEDRQRLSDYYSFKSEIAFKEQNFKMAYLYNLKGDSIHKVIESLDLKKSINLFEAKYQSEKKEKELFKTKNQLYKNEIQSKRKSFWLIIVSVISLFIALIGFLIYRQQKLKNKQQEQEFELKNAIAAIETQNKLHEQRLSISRDLHDNIGAQLTFVISSIDNLKYGNKITDSKINNQLTKISDFTKSTIIELRDTIWAMNNSEFTVEDLYSRILNFIEKAKSAKDDINFKFKIDEQMKTIKFSSVVGINLYRTIQEAINNAIKYSEAKDIDVEVKKVDSQIKITIQDNGKGFDIENTDFGNGLYNMKKRIEEVNGSCEIQSEPNKGTTITILLTKNQ